MTPGTRTHTAALRSRDVSVEGDFLRGDTLSRYARAQHRNLLIAASVGLLFVILDPTEISALGVTLESSERGWLLAILLAAIVYFEFAFFTASRADYHVWRRGLSDQRKHLAELKIETAFDRQLEEHDQHLAEGEKRAEIERRRAETEASREKQRATRDHLVPLVRWLAVRGWVDFWLAPAYGVAVFCVLAYQLVSEIR